MAVSTFGQWLDQVAERPEQAPDLPELVRGVARLWRDAKGERPRASAPETIGNWLAEHRGVHPDAMAAAASEYRTMRLSSSGRQLTIEEAERFHAGNAPSQGAGSVPAMAEPPAPGDLAASLPAIMAALGRIEAGQSAVEQRLSELTQGQLALLSAFDAPPSDGEQAAETAYQGGQEPAALDGHTMVDPPSPDAQAPAQGSLWASIMVPPPDFARMARDGSGGAEQAG